MSDHRLPPPSPFAPLYMSRGGSVGSHGSPNLSSHPVDHGSQVFRPFQRSSTGNGAQHSCGVPHLSLHGFGHPRSTSRVFGMSHADDVQTIQVIMALQSLAKIAMLDCVRILKPVFCK